MHNRKIRHKETGHKKIESVIIAEKMHKFKRIKAGTADINKLWEKIYLTILALYVGFNTLFTTTLKIAWPPYFFQAFTVICLTLVVGRIILIQDIPKKYAIAIAITAFVFLMSHYVSGYGLPFDLLMLLIGSYKVDFKKILETYLGVWIVILTITVISAMTGLTENYVYYDDAGENARMALGLSYPTELAAYMAFIMFTYVCIRQTDITFQEIGVMAALALAALYITQAKTDFYVMVLLLVTVLLLKRFGDKFNDFIQRKWVKICILVFPILLGVVIWRITAIYSPDKSWLVSLDEHLSGRLSLGEWAMSMYPPRMFGQYVAEKGPGENTWDYFFIDSSYISISIKYGVVFIYNILVLWDYRLKQLCEDKKGFIVAVMMIIFIQSALEHHMIQYWMNPFLLMFFADMTNISGKKHYAGREAGEEMMDLNQI